MTALGTLARALGGVVVGQQVLAPGPNHSRKDRSLSVRLSAMAPEGFVVHSHCGDDMGMCRDHVRARLGWDRPARFGRDQAETAAMRAHAEPGRREFDKLDAARRVWAEARHPAGTLVEAYLRSRGLELPSTVADEAIRFHPECPWRDEAAGQTIHVPAMVAVMRSIADEQITAVHRTRLTEDGRKVDRRMLGTAAGAAIMLAPFSAVGAGVTVGEGIETSLAAWVLGWSNVWALGSASAIAAFPVLVGIQSLTVLTETGDGGTNARATAAVAARYEAAGREVYTLAACRGDDINDAIMRRCA